jgi:hypothetical protein
MRRTARGRLRLVVEGDYLGFCRIADSGLDELQQRLADKWLDEILSGLVQVQAGRRVGMRRDEYRRTRNPCLHQLLVQVQSGDSGQ